MAKDGGSNGILIFLVDDDEDHQRLIEKTLTDQEKDFIFSKFSSPKAALENLSHARPDIIITDYFFPLEMNGLVFLRQARERGYSVPFIFLTGQGNEQVAADAFRLGADDYFTKEVGFAHFIKIAKAIRRASAHHRGESERQSLCEQYSNIENLCHQLMDEANDLIVIVDEEGRIVNGNRRAQEETGYTVEEAVGRPMLDFVAEEERRRVEDLFTVLIREGKSLRCQVITVGKNGRRLLQDVSASKVATSSGRCHVFIIARDITEQKAREQRLQWTKDMLGGVIDSMEDVIHVVDRDLKVLYCNLGMGRLSRGKITSEDILGRKLLDVFPFLLDRGVDREYRRVFETGGPLVTQEATNYHGEQIVTRTYKLPVRDDSGRVDKVVTIMRDITKDQLVLKEKQKLLQALDDSIWGVAITDQEGRLTYVNLRQAEMYGYESPEKMVGAIWEKLMPPDSLEESKAIVDPALAQTGHWIGESRGLKRSGEVFPILISISSLKADDGTKAGNICFIQDLSKEKWLDEELARKEFRLAELNEQLNSFISMTSHELRSPLANIEGFAGLMVERIDKLTPEEIRDFAGRISGNAVRLHRLIDDLLLFSREKKREVECSQVETEPLIREALGLLAGTLEAAGARVDLAVEVPTVRADRQKLFLVLKNLLENAAVYSREGIKPAIKVAVTRRKDGVVLFTVSDNGPGVLEEEREMIFEIFRRGSASYGKQGTGVGLALVRENVTRMGGKAWVTGRPGEGSSFCFTLPGA